MIENTSKKPHHHGDLHNALVQAGIALLAEGGTAALTLRKCAARAGVSHAAPAHHFHGLSGLKSEIAQEGLRMFRGYMLDAAQSGPQTPRARLKAICRGYLRFAVENRALFDLVFGFDTVVPMPTDKYDYNSMAYEVLRDACAPFVPAGTDPVIIESQVWSLIHGYSTLYLSGRFRTELDDRTENFDQVMTLLDRIGTDPAP